MILDTDVLERMDVLVARVGTSDPYAFTHGTAYPHHLLLLEHELDE